MPDARVQSAVTHWAPRFVANGVPLGDFEQVTAAIERWEAWCEAWCVRAAQHEALGRAALTEGCGLSAGEHLARAAVCYHFAKFVFVIDVDDMKRAHAKAVACLDLALPHLQPPGERVAIPYAGTVLFGTLRKPAGVARPPVVVMCMGLDSAKEEMGTNERVFLARGMATLAFDGPGQGEAEYGLPIRGDFEAPVGAVVDWIETRTDIDSSRIGLWGVSLGGYYAPRAAAFEGRIAACIALSGPYDLGDDWENLPQLTRDTFRVRSKCATEAAARRHAATLSLKGVADRIRCPLLVVAGKLDRIVPWQDGERLAREARGAVEFLLIGDGNHVANNRTYRYRAQSADWMAGRLGLPRS
jgi:dipeptidyl aminopeptidase/acylaminoacyl peptidase